jgi:hypothetical protein
VHKRIVVPLLATLGLAGGLAAAVEPVVATPFDIRHDAEELLDDLQKLQSHPGESEVLLERVQTLLAAHGDSMIAKGELCAPLAEFFASTLTRLGLSADFARAFNAPASRRLKELEGGAASEAELRHLAQAYPGTAAAASAWHRLANQAWDSGRLGLYLECAAKAGEPADAVLSRRMAAATELLAPARSPELPASLDGLEEMWHLDLGEVSAKSTGAARAGRRARRAQGFADRFMLTTGPGDLTAASDGLKFFLFDHLVGRIQGEVRALGNAPLGISQCRPVASRDGFIALGWLEDHATLLCLDHLGEVRWHWNTQTIGNVPALSAPVVLDDLVVIAAMASNNQDGAELRVMGFRTDTGRQQFSTVVARIPTPRQFGLNGYEAVSRAPCLAVAGGYLLVLSNNGVFARVGIDGNVQRIWSYPTAQEEVDDGLGNQRAAGRAGALVSDGAYALASPADAAGLVLMLGPGDTEPRRYIGDGANGEVLDVADGLALLGSGSTIALLDLATRSARWTQPFIGRGGMQGKLGQGRALVLSREAMGLYDLHKGEMISNRGLAEPMSMSATSDLLMLATADKVSGRGKGSSFLERLTAAAAAHPDDYRPWATLASLQESRGDREKAFASLSSALARGAPPDCAERAARLVRSQLEIAVGDAKAFPAPLAKLESLVAFADHIKGEIAFWNARHAELLGDLPRAAQGYRTALDSPSHLVHLKDNIDADVQALARAGLLRTKAIPPAPAEAALPMARPLTDWTLPTHRTEPTVIGGDLVLGYGDGFLLANRIADGKEAWRRTPERPVLGVINRQDGAGGINGEAATGILVDVVQGSSAAGAGMQSGDLLTSFLGHPTLNFMRDLRGSVIAMQPRAPFTATVLRAGKQVELHGLLGGEPVEPIMANRTSVLIWPTQSSALRGAAGRFPNKPEGVWFAVHDLSTGERLLRYSLSPTNEGGGMPPRPLLTDNDLVLTIEANDLICLPVRGNPDPENIQPLWRLPMGENTIDQVHLLGDGLLWLPEDGRNRITLVEVATGRTRFVLPEDVSASPLLCDSDVLSLGDDNHLSCWDIGLARLRWRTTQSYGRLLAVRGDSVFVFNENNQLVMLDRANGALRRLFGDWVTVEDSRVDRDRLCLHVRHEDRAQSLVLIALPAGTIQWERRLPHGLEVHQLVLGPDTFGCLLGDAQQDDLLMVGNDGAIRSACSLRSHESVVPTGGQSLASGPDGLRVLSAALPTPGAPLPCIEAVDGAALAEVGAATLPKLRWQGVGKGAYALARLHGALLVFARVEADGDAVEVRLGDSDPMLELLGQALLFQTRGAQLLPVPGGWQAAGTPIRLNPADQASWLGVIRLEPPALRVAGAGLLVRGASGGSTDGGGGPWWLHQGWRPVAFGP